MAATFWDMRNALGNELTAKLAFRTLVRLGRGALLKDFPGALTEASRGLLNDAQLTQVKEAAINRGWRIP